MLAVQCRKCNKYVNKYWCIQMTFDIEICCVLEELSGKHWFSDRLTVYGSTMIIPCVFIQKHFTALLTGNVNVDTFKDKHIIGL